MDIFSQWYALDNGETFGRNFYSFRAAYFEDKNARMARQNYFPKWEIRESSYDIIREKISQKSLRAKKEECLDLPPLVKQRITVELSPEQRRHYDNMLRDFITFIDDKAVSADLVLTKMLRLLQITTGHVSDEDGQIHTFANTPRMAALEELLDDIIPSTEKVIIWCIFKENYKQVREVCNKLGVKYVEVHGQVDSATKYNNVNLFNTDPTVRCFIGHASSVGIGINLCSASYSIVYSRSYSLEMDLQSEARNYRAGSERHSKITKIDIVAKDTVDEAVLDILENKLTDANKIVNIIKSSVKAFNTKK
jgi:SNF2 family DNA or RNA helicase